MKTYNGKTTSIKHIQKVLRTMDRTQIFRLYFQIFGKIDRHDLYLFIIKYAPSKRVRNAANCIVYYQYIPKSQEEIQKRLEFLNANIYHRTIELLKVHIKDKQKRPVMGKTHLYFVDIFPGSSEIGNLKIMPIKGNERFCETICKLADKYFN